MPTIREIVLELANTAEGVSAEDPVVADAGITERQFVTAAKHLVSTGYLFRALVKPHKSRYFTEKRHRDSWVEARYREVQKLILERKHKELARLREKEQALRRGLPPGATVYLREDGVRVVIGPPPKGFVTGFYTGNSDPYYTRL